MRRYERLLADLANSVKIRRKGFRDLLRALIISRERTAALGKKDLPEHLSEIEDVQANIRACERWLDTKDEIAELRRQHTAKDGQVKHLREWKKVVSAQLGMSKPKGLPNAAVGVIVELQNQVRSAKMSAEASSKRVDR